MPPKVSLFASAVRPALWRALFNSLEGTSVEVEIVFAGNAKLMPEIFEPTSEFGINWKFEKWNFKYIKTENIKPAQCYEIARRQCTGEVLVWIADDCEFPNDVIGKAYKYWKEQNNEKLILSIQTKESGYNLPPGTLFDMKDHCFFGYARHTPLMAPLPLISRKFVDELSGIDRRYVCGQYDNDILLRAYNQGAMVEIFGGPDCFIDIDHVAKSLLIGESKTPGDFGNRPFASGYSHDRKVLETSWTKNGNLERTFSQGDKHFKYTRYDEFEPFEDNDLLTKSQGPKGIWE